MNMYVWLGPEEELVFCCTAAELTIEKFETVGGVARAEGTITAIDYLRHSRKITESWEAEKRGERWVSRKKQDPEGKWSFKDLKAGEQVFTVSRELNVAMAEFIARKIEEHLASGSNYDGPKRYAGPWTGYTGPCRCSELRSSGVTGPPLTWSALTGGNYPGRCFTCSCGTMWYCMDEATSRWLPVSDEKARDMLLEYDGVPVRPLAYLGDSVYLLQTAREMGYMPVPRERRTAP